MSKKASKKKKRRTPPRLCVAFDTNVLYTDVAHHLLRRDVKDLIRNNSDHTDLRIEWNLADVVTGEREYQMQKKAHQIYGKVEELEMLLGHQLTTKEILSERIRSVIDGQLTELNIKILELSSEDVDWKEIIRRSVSRLPPFDPKEKEKGFRDAMIAETFLQLVSRSPTSTSSCRLAFVSNDELLRCYIEERTNDRQNVRILESINELEGLVNTLVSKVPESKISEWQEKASGYFFNKDDESTWYFREGIRNVLSEEYSAELAATPAGNYTRENGTWYISEPVFIKKERQRLHWMTQIKVEAKLFDEPADVSSGSLFGTSATPAIGTPSAGLLFRSSPKIQVGTGNSVMELYWSVSVSEQRETLSNPIIEGMEFIDTNWEMSRTNTNFLADLLKDYKPET